jgi:predicted trehalose synthase
MNALEFWARYWSDWVSATFLKAYLAALDQREALRERDGQSAAIGQIPLIPQSEADLRLLLDHCLLEQALEGARGELRGRPDWARVPIGMLLRILEAPRP